MAMKLINRFRHRKDLAELKTQLGEVKKTIKAAESQLIVARLKFKELASTNMREEERENRLRTVETTVKTVREVLIAQFELRMTIESKIDFVLTR